MKIGFDSYVDGLPSVGSNGLSDRTCVSLLRISKQSPGIEGDVHVDNEDHDVGAGDQGTRFGYAADGTADCIPITHSVPTKMGRS